MNNPDVTLLYKNVIEHVIENVRKDFTDAGLDEAILYELQDLWESKLIESNVLTNLSMHHQRAVQQQQQLHGQQGFLPTLAQPMSLPHTGYVQQSALPPNFVHMQPPPQRPGVYDTYINYPINQHPPSPYNYYTQSQQNIHMQQQQQQHILQIQQQQLRQQQQQHASVSAPALTPQQISSQQRNLTGQGQHQNSRGGVPQFDGPSPSDEEEDLNAGAKEDLLGSDLDDEDEEDTDHQTIANVALCQYEKAARTKNKWRCIFRDGIVHINGIDYAFQKATGEFEWI